MLNVKEIIVEDNVFSPLKMNKEDIDFSVHLLCHEILLQP